MYQPKFGAPAGVLEALPPQGDMTRLPSARRLILSPACTLIPVFLNDRWAMLAASTVTVLRSDSRTSTSRSPRDTSASWIVRGPYLLSILNSFGETWPSTVKSL